MTDSAKIALFDLDGTLVDYDGAMQRDMLTLQAPGEPRYARKDLKEEDAHLLARRRMIRQLPGWWSSMKRFQLGWDVLAWAKDVGFQPHVLTQGPWNTVGAWTEKVEWCRRELVDVPVTITQDKSLVYGRVLVDDWPGYVEPWLRKRPRGLVIMPAHPWNETYHHERVIRYDGTNPAEVQDHLERAFSRPFGQSK
jgi:5'-nucleotidase